MLTFGFCLSPYFFTKKFETLGHIPQTIRHTFISVCRRLFFIYAKLKYITDHTDLVLDTLQDLGLCVNSEKSSTDPSQQKDYLGYSIDTRGQFPVIKAQKNRVIRIKRQTRSVLKQGQASARVIAKVAGLCVSVADCWLLKHHGQTPFC